MRQTLHIDVPKDITLGKLPTDPSPQGAWGAEPPTSGGSGGSPPRANTVELRGFEPLTPSMRTRCATGLRYSPKDAVRLANIEDSSRAWAVPSRLGSPRSGPGPYPGPDLSLSPGPSLSQSPTARRSVYWS
jgi:hypothetical protein